MQAQRKFDEMTETAAAHDHAAPRSIESDLSAWDDAIAASPARRLHQELVAHFEQATATPGQAAAIAERPDKWPMATRIAIILGASAALWVAIGTMILATI